MLSTGPSTRIRNTGNTTAVARWNLCEKASTTSLDLLRLHMAFIFVLCASVAVEVTQLSAINLTIEFRPDALGCALLLYEDPLSPVGYGDRKQAFVPLAAAAIS